MLILREWFNTRDILFKAMILTLAFPFVSSAFLIERRGDLDIIIVSMLSIGVLILIIIFFMGSPSMFNLFFKVLYADFGQAEYLLH